jgi:hypothetical protein
VTTAKEAMQEAYDAEPHYVIHVGEPGPTWHSEPYPTRKAAQEIWGHPWEVRRQGALRYRPIRDRGEREDPRAWG